MLPYQKERGIKRRGEINELKHNKKLHYTNSKYKTVKSFLPSPYPLQRAMSFYEVAICFTLVVIIALYTINSKMFFTSLKLYLKLNSSK